MSVPLNDVCLGKAVAEVTASTVDVSVAAVAVVSVAELSAVAVAVLSDVGSAFFVDDLLHETNNTTIKGIMYLFMF
jgi:hypothetical protein